MKSEAFSFVSSQRLLYANLFSYAVGENDGDKDEFLDNFKNSYTIVRSDIEKYLDNVVLK